MSNIKCSSSSKRNSCCFLLDGKIPPLVFILLLVSILTLVAPRAITPSEAFSTIPVLHNSLQSMKRTHPMNERAYTLPGLFLPQNQQKNQQQQQKKLASTFKTVLLMQKSRQDQNQQQQLQVEVVDDKSSQMPVIEESITSSRRYNHGIHPMIQNAMAWKSIKATLSKQQKSAMTFLAAAFIMASVLLAPIHEAFAAPSGGRMGGSFGGSERQSYSRSYQRSSPSSSYSAGSYARGFSQGYGTGYFSRPSVTVVPSIGGYGYGFFGAPVLSPGVTVVSRGPSIVDVLIFGFFATVLFRTFTSMGDDSSNALDTPWNGSSLTKSALGPGVTVAQISVAVRVPNRNDPSNILSFLERLSRTARTDSRVGISNLVSQVALELLRQKRSIFAADTDYKYFQKDEKGAQRHFSSKAIQERSKFEKESTSKYGGVDYSSSFGGGGDSSASAFSPLATNAVVTLLISIDGDSTKLPQINNMSDLEKALTRIATDVKVDDCLRSAEVLWTPDDRNDVLSDRDIYVDYPKLRSI